MNEDKKIVIGLTHVDLGWKKGRKEMAELFDNYIICLLDLVERYPDLQYMLEQALHYRDLKTRRPDLFEKLKKWVESGTLEIVTGLISTIDNNVTNGESFVRDMQIGTKWLEKEFGTKIKTCMMIDTFGFPPQMPQIINQFGFNKLFANRLGGDKINDVFWAIGLDGSKLLVMGRDCLSPTVRQGHIEFRIEFNRKHLEELFESASSNKMNPLLVIPYTENEVVPDSWVIDFVHKNSNEYRFGTLYEFMQSLETSGNEWPCESGDLNPEFTGAFSLRHRLRIENRKTEYLLLEAEKWQALFRHNINDELIKDNWWEMGYTQFHDIITGSHPTDVYLDCLNRFEVVQNNCMSVITEVAEDNGNKLNITKTKIYTIWNGLPWDREEEVAIPVPQDWAGIEKIIANEKQLDFYIKDNKIVTTVLVPAMSSLILEVFAGEALQTDYKEVISNLENEFLKIEFGQGYVIKKMIYKPTQTIILENCNDLLVLQEDKGNFQIENPVSAEIKCGAGNFSINVSREGNKQIAQITGTFPEWLENQVSYRISLNIHDNNPIVDVVINVDWLAEAARLRLNIPSCLGPTENYYEVPFGVAKRSPYTPRIAAKGEWAAHRFVAMENKVTNMGIALANTGIVGVETMDGILKTTLLRAPYAEYAGMKKDDTSSEHGSHTFNFRLLAYQGTWADSGIIKSAQELNSPYLVLPDVSLNSDFGIKIGETNIILSSIKKAENDFIVIRLYETAGRQTVSKIEIARLKEAWESDLWELPKNKLEFEEQNLELSFNPFEIKTILIKY